MTYNFELALAVNMLDNALKKKFNYVALSSDTFYLSHSIVFCSRFASFYGYSVSNVFQPRVSLSLFISLLAFIFAGYQHFQYKTIEKGREKITARPSLSSVLLSLFFIYFPCIQTGAKYIFSIHSRVISMTTSQHRHI